MLPDVFEEFEVVYVFLATFCFSISLSIGKRSAPAPPSSLSGFYGPEIFFIKTSYHIETNQMIWKANQLTVFCIK